MTANRLDLWVAVAVMALGLFMVLVGVPDWVVTPKSVRIPVLSPAFWPSILAWLLVGLGAGLAVMALSGSRAATAVGGGAGGAVGGAVVGRAIRLLVLAGLLVVFVALLPVIGMVWASGLLFAGLVLLGRSPHPVAGLIVAVGLPLALYAFFQHVAGVAVPQGDWVTLP